ncbi:MAG: cyclic nucleotide-binding domain-containing protein [Gammaproteobacteria bacterium]|nr:cyclic nucleotide-binding domain-containing protein [Gammaproteobacteria bacterium]MBT3868302.1 cyclic nucleotide-binding domain-containing protein [Gammaproteobacteria bacterium]MBT4381649.1 cyclic nucleotide-binding domain-containing protein [Gammaproteobacteria bacterium]MBT4617166.1 cyclic nucleotide-binding domain-containing protein [Gammaproteobacteria bacterium]MBT5197249.1 cyclic nucleotide-binding domain-containing protein [Gammaproteobacteria bacterium]
MEAEHKELIKNLIPFKQLSEGELSAVLEHVTVDAIPKGKMIFKRTEQNTKVYWLLIGTVDLVDEKFEAKSRKAGEEVTRNPIDNNTPHRLTAITTEDSTLLVCDRSNMAVYMGGGPGASAADEEEPAVDWMSTLLSSPLFEFIPPSNIQTLFSKFEEKTYAKGDIVITQGDRGDYFYVIQKGRVKLERSVGDKTLVIKKLKAGDNFGQDALVSDFPRNATVTMTSNGTLMRLSEPDFQSLLLHPVIETVGMEEVQEMIKQGDPMTYIIDVRTPREAKEDKIPGSVNLPLLLLRKNLSKLNNDAVYITVCDGGKRSELGAYQLNEEGYSAYVLKR